MLHKCLIYAALEKKGRREGDFSRALCVLLLCLWVRFLRLLRLRFVSAFSTLHKLDNVLLHSDFLSKVGELFLCRFEFALSGQEHWRCAGDEPTKIDIREELREVTKYLEGN